MEAKSYLDLRTRLSHALTILQEIVLATAAPGLTALRIAMAEAGASAITALVMYLSKIQEDEDAVIEFLKGTSAFLKKHVSTIISFLQIPANEKKLSEAKETVAEIVRLLDGEVASYMAQMSVVETRLTNVKLELAKMDAICR